MKRVFWLGLLGCILASSQASLASMDWSDFCKPDRIALAQALKEYPADRFEQSRCFDSVYRRGTCTVVPHVPASGRDDEILFSVKVKTNAGIDRTYEIQMSEGDGVCQVRSIRRRGKK